MHKIIVLACIDGGIRERVIFGGGAPFYSLAGERVKLQRRFAGDEAASEIPYGPFCRIRSHDTE